MKNQVMLFLVIVAVITVSSCASSEKVAYIQGSERFTEQQYEAHSSELYDAKILPKDILTITVNTTDPEAAQPFNLTVPSLSTGTNTYSQPSLQAYLVDNKGEVNFPVLGMISLVGLTKREAEQKIAGLLNEYLKEVPVVTVKFVNYKISVIGEVLRPNSFTISNEKVNIFEALAMAGDLTIWGKRDNVKIIREDAEGNKRVIPMNLNDRNIIFSPNFYLQQNDVVYVEPNEVKARNSEIGSATGIWLSATSIVISVATLVINVLK